MNILKPSSQTRTNGAVSMPKRRCKLITVCSTLMVTLFVLTSNAQAATYYFHNDHLGSPQVLTDENQTVVWQGSYDPFGEVTETVSAVEQNLRFPGQYLDRETGLHYNYFRTYDPSIGRYTQSDPIGLHGGINTFGYVGGNPVSFVDPYGLKCNMYGCWLDPIEKGFADDGQHSNYYAAACKGGDSYACQAGKVAANDGLPAKFTNWRLRNSLKRNGANDQQCDNLMEEIRKDLAKEHAFLLSSGSEDKPIVISKDQISSFHNKIFRKNGAGSVFGGDIPGSNFFFRWCSMPSCQP